MFALTALTVIENTNTVSNNYCFVVGLEMVYGKTVSKEEDRLRVTQRGLFKMTDNIAHGYPSTSMQLGLRHPTSPLKRESYEKATNNNGNTNNNMSNSLCKPLRHTQFNVRSQI